MQKNYSQDFPDIKFSLFNTANGLPTNLVNIVLKDHRGLMWFATADKGLLRYDGKKVKIYNRRYHKNPGIASDYIAYLCEDKAGWLWVSSLSGLYHFDPITEKTIAYRHDEKNKNSLGTNEKPLPFVDSKGRLWVSSRAGLQQFDAAAQQFINYSSPAISNPAWQELEKDVGKVLEDGQHRLWAGSAYGLYLVDTIRHQLKPYYTGTYMWLTDIYQEASQQIWVSFWGGVLKKFYPETGRYDDQYGPAYPAASITDWEDQQHKKWMCFSDLNSFVLFDPVSREYHRYSTDILNPTSINGFGIGSIYKDDENMLWICTTAGINIVDLQLQHFSNHYIVSSKDKLNANVLGHPKALCVLPDGYLISDWRDGLVYEYDKNWKLKSPGKNIQPYPEKSCAILNIYRDEDGATWYGTDNGLVKQIANHLQRYVPNDEFLQIEGQYAARNMLKRNDGSYWVRFRDRGVYAFEPTTGKFGKCYRKQYEGSALCMEYDRNNNLWIGTDNGFYSYRQARDSFIRIPILHPDKVIQDKYNIIGQFVFDENNICWIAAYGGLIKYDPANNKVEFIIDSLRTDEMPLMKIVQDKKGILWMESGTEIIAYKKKENHFYYFSSANGLPAEFMCDREFFSFLDDSTIAVGNPRVVSTFNINQLITEKKSPKILFTDVSIDGKRSIVEAARNGSRSIEAEAGEKNIAIHFSVLDYSATNQNKLYYRLSSSQNDDWLESKDGDINILNLPAGKYILEVKAGNSANLSDTPSEQLTIIVNPYWYQSVFFKLCALLSVACGIYLFVKWRIRSVKAAAALKQQITETEMAALKAQMNPHFMFNCINSIDAFIHSNDKYNATLYLNKFAKLLRGILESSRQNTVTLSKDTHTLKLYVELEQLRHENKFKTHYHIDEELMNSDYKVPPLIVQPFVENAILHGLKNRDDNNGLLTIEIKKTGDKIRYTIQDNGIGREAAKQIMQNKESHYGMQMSYDRVKLFNKEQQPSVIITDLRLDNKPAGTQIEVLLKIV